LNSKALSHRISWFWRQMKTISLFLFYLLAIQTPLFAKNVPIDIVYLWVDGKDPNWLAIKNSYLPDSEHASNLTDDSCNDYRYANHEELRYSLRSVYQFAPFFNHIYIVTMNQRPAWLKDHPQITVIDHTEIFKNLDDLPTFNSQAIESHIHRIPNLSEHFIYFNDDVFLGKPVAPTDFFSSDGKILVLFEKGYTVSPTPAVQASSYRQSWINSNALLDAYYVKERRHRLCHAPFALRKSFIEITEALFPSPFSLTSSHKFRTKEDFNLVNGFLQYVWIYQKKGEKGKMTNQMISLGDDSEFSKFIVDIETLKKDPPHTFCLEDGMVGTASKTCTLLTEFLQSFYPNPAPWELEEIE
jgi:hypothetical protein